MVKPQVNVLSDQLLLWFRMQKNRLFLAVGKRQENAVRHEIHLLHPSQPPQLPAALCRDPARFELVCG